MVYRVTGSRKLSRKRAANKFIVFSSLMVIVVIVITIIININIIINIAHRFVSATVTSQFLHDTVIQNNRLVSECELDDVWQRAGTQTSRQVREARRWGWWVE